MSGALREEKGAETTVLGHVLRHNAWANRALLEHCAALGPDALDLEAAGTYGTLYGTLQHLVGGEQFYIELLTDEVIGAPVRKTARRTLGDLMTISAKTGARAIEIAASDDPERVIGDPASADWTTAGIVLAQLVNHGNEHRAHATTILGANGRTPPKIGAWSYGIANGISKNDGD
jgi:uncharacterized damage-inducible protein DinB